MAKQQKKRAATNEFNTPCDVKTVRSFDGTELCCVSCGEGEQALILAPGLATPPVSYKRIVERFAPFCRIVTWDMRGSFRSGRAEAGVESYQIRDHVADLEAIVEAEGLSHFVLGGWSMGVEIALEYQHRHPQHCDALILINGGYGNILTHAFHLPMGDTIPLAALRWARKNARLLQPLIRKTLPQPWWIRGMGLVGLVHPKSKDFPKVVEQFATLDFELYFAMMEKLHEHSAETLLDSVNVPTLITAGTKDKMTPLSTAEVMARRIKQSRLLVVPGGTHYTPIEFPDLINRAIAEFLSERGWSV
ncbi:MAG: alpha/beta hydrolase [Myxococcota bacterium]|jgi:pimeloyl-ACP methyl ester carboxylesterase|nr:alpha/beta hydrolase [Myxococcota bacterium]